MSEALERRYRTLIRMLPKRYREERGEELLGTLMDGADGDRRWPDARETLSLAGLSLRARFTAGAARYRAWGMPRPGEAARAVALIGSALLALGGLITLMQIYGQLHTLIPRSATGRPNIGWTLRTELPALWLVVYLLLVFGRWVPARVLAVSLVVTTTATLPGAFTAVDEHLLLTAVAAGAALAARGADARRVGRHGHLPALAIAGTTIGATVVGLATADRDFPDHWDVSQALFLVPSAARGSLSFYETVAAVLAVVAVLALRSPVWALAAAFVGSALILPATVYLAGHGGIIGQGLHRVAAIEAVLVGLAGVAIVMQRRRARGGEAMTAG
ncbi:MAG: hypothetical protein HOW97_33590 [Catenulispora sp.]|nr:hypothetical protein [Catenulispora sp.]